MPDSNPPSSAADVTDHTPALEAHLASQVELVAEPPASFYNMVWPDADPPVMSPINTLPETVYPAMDEFPYNMTMASLMNHVAAQESTGADTDAEEPLSTSPSTLPPPSNPVAPPAPMMATVFPAHVPAHLPIDMPDDMNGALTPGLTTAMNIYDFDAATALMNVATVTFGVPAQFQQQYTLNNLAPPNENIKSFLRGWVRQSTRLYGHNSQNQLQNGEKNMALNEPAVNGQINKPAFVIRAADIEIDRCDLQGIDWKAMGTTFEDARERRRRTYQNYTSIPGSDTWLANPARNGMPHTKQPYFNFRQTHIRKDIRIPHFQLRNLLATASRDRVYFPGSKTGTVSHYNMLTEETSLALKFPNYADVQISTIAAGHGVLVAGGFSGEYCVTNIDAEFVDQPAWEVKCSGSVTARFESGISNHIQVHGLRGAGPVAAFSSNDQALRVLDIATNKLLCDVRFDMPLNCSAVSPDGRLRIVVGDTKDAFIIPAVPDRHTALSADGIHHRPDILQSLSGHRDFGFSCAWADDGYTLATGGQDRAVKIWDARRWTNAQGEPEPVLTLKTKMAGARSLHFSPVGAGKRLLFVVEEADIVSVIDAQTYAAAQTIELFGEIAGVSQTPDGQGLTVLCADTTRGGLLQFQRNLDWQAQAAAVHDETSAACGPMYSLGPGLGGPGRPELRRRSPEMCSETFDWEWCGIGHGTDVSAAAHARRLRVSARRIRAAATARARRASRTSVLDTMYSPY